MELGFFTMPLHPPGSDTTKTLDHDIEQMVVLDELGYKEAYVGEHFTFTWENIPSPDLFIAKAAAMTENIVFGTGITCMPIHNPAVVAHRIAQLDHQTHGRFHWGVGSSFPRRVTPRCSWQTGTDGSRPGKGLKPSSRFGPTRNPDITRPISGNLRFPSTVRTLSVFT